MAEIQQGLYQVEEEIEMPCQPGRIRFYHYLIPSTLGKVEREEAAARILYFSQQLDQWVGVSWRRLAEMMQEDLDLHERIQEVNHHNFDEGLRVRRETYKWFALSALTLGVYTLFVKKPKAQMREPEGQLPFTTLFLTGPQPVITAIHQLIDEGLLRRESRGSEEDPIDIFFPTPKLIQVIMERQGLATA